MSTTTTFNWAGWTNRGTVLTTELNSLATAAYSAVGTLIDNSINKDQWAALDVVLASLTPTAGAYLSAFIVESLDGTTYQDPPVTSNNAGFGMFAGSESLTIVTGARRVKIGPFRIMPSKLKFVMANNAQVSFAASANTATLFTTNEVGIT